VLLIAWGREARRVAKKQFDGFSGLHAECLPWLHDRKVAVLGSDGISDPMPFVGTPQWPFPVHQIGITAIGLHLIDNVALARLGERCAALGRWEFLFTMGPASHHPGYRLPGQPGGRPVNAYEELRALLQRYARAADERDLDTLASLFHPEAEISGSRGPQIWRNGSTRCGRRGLSPEHAPDRRSPHRILDEPAEEAHLDTYAIVHQLA
jgi:hypothetical protein